MVPFASKLLGSRNDARTCRQEFVRVVSRNRNLVLLLPRRKWQPNPMTRSVGFSRRPSWQNLQARCTVIDAMLRRSDQR
jgi:hypothetical protein